MTETPIIERALQLAQAGGCRDLAEIERKLAAEGYTSISAHLSGSSFRRQLRQLLRSGTEPVQAATAALRRVTELSD